MAISTRLGRCWRRPATRRVGEQGVQGRQRGQRGDRVSRRRHRAAGDGVEHPDRNLLKAREERLHEAAARHHAGRALDHLVKEHPAPGPRMPSVENGDLVACGRTMGLVVRSCITRSGRTRRWATSRLHRKFSYGRPRYPGQLRRPPRPWRSDPSCTNSQPGPPNGGRPPELAGYQAGSTSRTTQPAPFPCCRSRRSRPSPPSVLEVREVRPAQVDRC